MPSSNLVMSSFKTTTKQFEDGDDTGDPANHTSCAGQRGAGTGRQAANDAEHRKYWAHFEGGNQADRDAG